MVQEANGSLLGLWNGLCAASGDSAPKLFSCVSGFNISAVTQNTLKEAGCCLFKFLKDLLSLGWFCVRRPVRWHCANHRSSRLCAHACVWSLPMLNAVSSGIEGLWPIPDVLWVVLPSRSEQGRCRAAAVAHSLCLHSLLVGECKWSCLCY